MDYQDRIDLLNFISNDIPALEYIIFWNDLRRRYKFHSYAGSYVVTEHPDRDKIIKELLRFKLEML